MTYLQSIAAKPLTSFSSYTTGNAIRHCCLCGLGGDVNACFTQQCCSSRKLQCDWLDTKTQQKKSSTAKTLFCIQAVEVTVCLVFFFWGGGRGESMLHASWLRFNANSAFIERKILTQCHTATWMLNAPTFQSQCFRVTFCALFVYYLFFLDSKQCQPVLLSYRVNKQGKKKKSIH